MPSRADQPANGTRSSGANLADVTNINIHMVDSGWDALEALDATMLRDRSVVTPTCAGIPHQNGPFCAPLAAANSTSTCSAYSFGVPLGIHDDAGPLNFAEHGLPQDHE